MAVRDILIQVGAGPKEPERLAHAAELAERLGAELRGLHIQGPRLSDMAGGSGDISWIASPEVRRITAEREAQDLKIAAAARDIFEGVVGESPASAWEAVDWSAEAVIARARRCDLTIVGAGPDPGLATPIDADRLACACGRPVLILPPGGRPIARTVLVAWNGGREATRALHDALPLLRQAQSVTVVSVETADAPLGPDEALQAHLRAHGIGAAFRRRRGPDPAAVLLAEAHSLGADLIVMGVYGRSRVAEWVLGGVSRSLLREPALPILISH